jgi:hypothetical protein
LEYLMTFERVRAEEVADTLARLIESRQRTEAASQATYGPIARLKQRLPIRQLVARYVDLNEAGRGPCPWHQPDRHSSFAVNDEGSYFFCFHEWKGGDVVEFYRRIHEITTAEAVKQLNQRFPEEPGDGTGR